MQCVCDISMVCVCVCVCVCLMETTSVCVFASVIVFEGKKEVVEVCVLSILH